MNSLCIAIRKGPYGMLSAAEGVRHLIGAAQTGMSACAVLVDDGVYLAKQGQDPGGTAWTSLSAVLEQALSPSTGSSPEPGCTFIVARWRPGGWIPLTLWPEWSWSTMRNWPLPSRRQLPSSSSKAGHRGQDAPNDHQRPGISGSFASACHCMHTG